MNITALDRSQHAQNICSEPLTIHGTTSDQLNFYYKCKWEVTNTYEHMHAHMHTHTHARTHTHIYRVSQEECVRLREGVPYVKVYRYNPKHLRPKLNGYGDNGQRKVWSSGGTTHCTCQLTTLSMSFLQCGVILRQFSSRSP